MKNILFKTLIMNFDGKKLCYKGVITNLIGTCRLSAFITCWLTILAGWLAINLEQINNKIVWLKLITVLNNPESAKCKSLVTLYLKLFYKEKQTLITDTVCFVLFLYGNS